MNENADLDVIVVVGFDLFVVLHVHGDVVEDEFEDVAEADNAVNGTGQVFLAL